MFSPFSLLFSPLVAMAAYTKICSELAREGERESLKLRQLAEHSGLLAQDWLRHLTPPVLAQQPK